MEESKEDKLMVSRFNGTPTESFHLWKLRVEAVLESGSCFSVVSETEKRPPGGSDAFYRQNQFDRRCKKAAAIIVTALGDKPLRAVQKHWKNPSEMWKKLCATYGSITTSNKLSLLIEAFSKRKSSKESMVDHIEELETGFIELDSVGLPLNKLMKVAILLSSIKEEKGYTAVIATFRTMEENDMSWDTVTTRLLHTTCLQTENICA